MCFQRLEGLNGMALKTSANFVLRMAQFNQYDSQRGQLSVTKDFCREKGNLYLYAKEKTFVQQGEVGKYLGVVESGYFKYTVITSSGNEAVVGFAFEGEIVADFYNS